MVDFPSPSCSASVSRHARLKTSLSLRHLGLVLQVGVRRAVGGVSLAAFAVLLAGMGNSEENRVALQLLLGSDDRPRNGGPIEPECCGENDDDDDEVTWMHSVVPTQSRPCGQA